MTRVRKPWLSITAAISPFAAHAFALWLIHHRGLADADPDYEYGAAMQGTLIDFWCLVTGLFIGILFALGSLFRAERWRPFAYLALTFNFLLFCAAWGLFLFVFG